MPRCDGSRGCAAAVITPVSPLQGDPAGGVSAWPQCPGRQQSHLLGRRTLVQAGANDSGGRRDPICPWTSHSYRGTAHPTRRQSDSRSGHDRFYSKEKQPALVPPRRQETLPCQQWRPTTIPAGAKQLCPGPPRQPGGRHPGSATTCG